MKNVILLIMVFFSYSANAQESIYDIAINDIQGSPIYLNEFSVIYSDDKNFEYINK